MAQYTLQLRELESIEGRENLKSWFKDYELTDYLTNEQVAVIETYGVFDKDKLADKIIDHYYMREIGLETPALFKLKVKVAMQEIMEEKAPLIYSASIKIDPTNEFEINNNSQATNTIEGKTTNNGLNIHSNTPQGQINKTEILNGTYASDTDANEGENKTNQTENNRGESHSTGRNRSQVALLNEYRNFIRMINREIIEDLAELFIGIY